MKLIVTGALGHIGSRLIHSLKPSDVDEVVLIDNLSTQRYCSLFSLPKGIAWRFVEADVTDERFEMVQFEDAAAVVHLAAITNAPESFKKQNEVERVNFEGTRRIAQSCIRFGAPLLFVSTTSVYGVTEGVVDEGCPDELLRPQSPYAESKLRAERLLTDLANSDGLRFVTLRFGTIYGASIGMRFHTAVNKFIWQACLQRPLTVWRTALDQKRPYLDLGDAVDAIRFVVGDRLFDNEIYNVVTDNMTIREITEVLRRHIPDVEVNLVEDPIMNQLSYTVDRSKFEERGFRFKGSIKYGVAETVHLFRALTTKTDVLRDNTR